MSPLTGVNTYASWSRPLQRFVIGVRRSQPKALGRSFTPGGALPALVLGPVDEREHLLDHAEVEWLEQLLAGVVELDVRLQHRVEDSYGQGIELVPAGRPELAPGRVSIGNLG